MGAQTSDQIREFWALPEVAPNEAHTLLASRTFYKNALQMIVAGKVQPYVSGTAGSSMGGFINDHYDLSASDIVLPDNQPAVLKRGVAACPGKAGDLPTELLLGKPVYFDDSSGTVKATAAANDLSGTLRRIEGNAYWVEI